MWQKRLVLTGCMCSLQPSIRAVQSFIGNRATTKKQVRKVNDYSARQVFCYKQDKISCGMRMPLIADSSSYAISSVADMLRLNRYSLLIFHTFWGFQGSFWQEVFANVFPHSLTEERRVLLENIMNRSLASKNIYHILWNSRVHYRFHNSCQLSLSGERLIVTSSPSCTIDHNLAWLKMSISRKSDAIFRIFSENYVKLQGSWLWNSI